MKFDEYPEYAFDILKNSINCNSCPPERNCCNNFSEKFSYKLGEDTARIIFKGKAFEFYDKGILKYDRNFFKFIGGRCPQLTDKNKCALHDKKKELGLTGCMDFPIYFGNISGEDEDRNKSFFEGIKVDFRCFYVENNWNRIYQMLVSFSNNNLICVLYKEDKRFKQEFLSDFNNLFKQEAIQEQSL